MSNRIALTAALVCLFVPAVVSADPRKDPNRVDSSSIKEGGPVLAILGGIGLSWAGTENDGDQDIDGYEEMNVYHGIHAELSVLVGRNILRGERVFFDIEYHARASINDVDVLQRHQFALLVGRTDMFAMLGVGGSVLHDLELTSFAPCVSMSVVSGYRFGPVSFAFPFEAEFPILGGPAITTMSVMIGYANL